MRAPLVAWLVLALQVAFLMMGWRGHQTTQPLFPWRFAGRVATDVAVIVLYFQVVGLTLLRHPLLLRLANLLSVLVFLSMFAFHWDWGVPIDFGILADTGGLVLDFDTISMVIERLTRTQWAIVGVVLTGLTVFTFATPWMGRWPKVAWRWPTLAGSVLALSALVALPTCNDNDMSYFLRSAWDDAFQWVGNPDLPAEVGYPYVNRGATDLPADRQNPDRPHVFVVMMESFNARFVHACAENGMEYMPYFNSLIGQGLYVERFYSTSMQTSRGHLAAMASILPTYRGRVSVDFPNLRLRALPALMSDRGYEAFEMQGFMSLACDRMAILASQLGFGACKYMNSEFVTEQDRPYCWPWGVQDRRFYQKVFGYLDQRRQGDDPKRFFVVLATAMHHYPFEQAPPDQWRIYPHPADTTQHAANSIHAADEQLREFFDQLHSRDYLANSVVIITGDHGFPTGEHGSCDNMRDSHEENFRVPFLLIWPGHVQPRIVRQTAYSQVDIAPTVMDLLHIREDNHFIGRSILPGDDAPQQPIYTIQPYRGVYLSTVIWPLKYVIRLRGGEEMIFNLEADPQEQDNLIAEYRGSDIYRRLKDGIGAIKLNQQLIEHDRIWRGN